MHFLSIGNLWSFLHLYIYIHKKAPKFIYGKTHVDLARICIPGFFYILVLDLSVIPNQLIHF